MTDRIRVDEVPGGVWLGASVYSERDLLHGTVVQFPRGLGVHADTEGDGDTHHLDEGWSHIMLDDELGLGLAGLAARVAQRLGVRGMNVERTIGEFAWWLCEQEWSPFEMQETAASLTDWPEPQLPCPDVDLLVGCSQYLALTDRLCAAVGLNSEGHEVAEWAWNETIGGWDLSTAAMRNEGTFWQLRTAETNWLLVLSAAIAMVSLRDARRPGAR